MDRATLQDLQLERMRWSLSHAYDNVGHYRQAFDEAGVTPDDLSSLTDLARFPFTTKADLRDNYPFGMFAVPREQVARIHASSGTTGRPTVVGYTMDDLRSGPTSSPGRSRPRGVVRATSSTSPTATGSSPADWGRTTAPSGSGARWCRSLEG